MDGYDTDDLIVFVRNSTRRKNKRKLLGQVKHTISFTQSNSILTEVMRAAWNDYNNTSIFTKKRDRIALITGPLKEADFLSVSWILDQAHTKESEEFYNHVTRANFSPSKANEKLNVIRHHLKIANNNVDVTDDDFYDFLKHFYLLNYDLGKEVGVVLSLLHSHMSQFNLSQPESIFSRIVDIVQAWNQSAGTVTTDTLPDDIREAFKEKYVGSIPSGFAVPSSLSPVSHWNKHAKATSLALATLIGSWDENNPSDVDAIRRLIDGL